MANQEKYTLEQVGASFHLFITAYLIGIGYPVFAYPAYGFFVRLNGHNSIFLDPNHQDEIPRLVEDLQRIGCTVEVRKRPKEDGRPQPDYLVVNKY